MQKEYLTQEQQKQKTTKTILTVVGSILFLGLAAWGVYALSQQDTSPSYLPPTLSELTADEFVLGNRDAQITLIEYGDFQCPACRAFAPYLEKLHEDFPTQLKIAFRHFPLPQHLNAQAASIAVEAAGLQGKFWEMAGLIYEEQNNWAGSSSPEVLFSEFARRLGLDEERFNRDSLNPDLKAKVMAHLQSGNDAGVNSTPSFFLNGTKITNPSSYEQFKQLIEQAIQ